MEGYTTPLDFSSCACIAKDLFLDLIGRQNKKHTRRLK
jgi:hypothetical protein